MGPAERVGRVLAGRYELSEYLGSGGVGDVYRARDHRLEFREVAIKLLKPNTPEDQVARFKREALLTGGLRSPHLVQVTDFATLADGQHFIVMELLKGEGLDELLAREGRLPVERTLTIADGLLAGLEAAHAAGVVHRDLKPENIWMVEEPGVKDHVKVVDFGFARVFTSNALDVTGNANVIVGTVSYMAPEQLRARKVNQRADLFSVGALIFRMLTGRLPYETRGPEATMMSAAQFRALRLDQPPAMLSHAAPELLEYKELEVVLRKALAINPANRFSTAGEFRQALHAAAGAAGILARPASEPGQSGSRWSLPASGFDKPLDRLSAESGNIQPATTLPLDVQPRSDHPAVPTPPPEQTAPPSSRLVGDPSQTSPPPANDTTRSIMLVAIGAIIGVVAFLLIRAIL